MSNFKPFNLDQARKGAPIQTRDGRPAKFIAYVPEARPTQNLVVLVGSSLWLLRLNGMSIDDSHPSTWDIGMAPTEKSAWVARSKEGYMHYQSFDSEKEIKAFYPFAASYHKITWEE